MIPNPLVFAITTDSEAHPHRAILKRLADSGFRIRQPDWLHHLWLMRREEANRRWRALMMEAGIHRIITTKEEGGLRLVVCVWHGHAGIPGVPTEKLEAIRSMLRAGLGHGLIAEREAVSWQTIAAIARMEGRA